MAEWQIDTQPIDVNTASFELTDSNSKLTVSDNGVAFDPIDISGNSMYMEVIGTSLFRRTAPSTTSLTAWTTTAEPENGQISLDIKSTGMQGGATRWFFIIGEGDIRNGLTMQMHSVEDRRVEIRKNRGTVTITRH